MDNQETSQSCGIQPHDHSSTGRNLMLVGRRYETIKNGIGIAIGSKEIRVFKCKICTFETMEMGPDLSVSF